MSGIPSTVHALAARGRALEATLAAGSILLPHTKRPILLAAAALPVHLSLSFGWALVLSVILPRRGTVAWGALAGLGIAALDLGIIGGRFPRVRSLPVGPQIADHLLFGATVGMVLERRRTSRSRSAPADPR
ncbi:MAG: hypothetical protein ACRD02_01120 [Acidimicrobiia bacterium]